MNFAPAARVPRVSFEADDGKENKKYSSLLYLAALNTGSSRVTNQPTSEKKKITVFTYILSGLNTASARVTIDNSAVKSYLLLHRSKQLLFSPTLRLTAA